MHQRRDIAMPKHSKKHSRASRRKRESSTSSAKSSSSTCSTREKRDCKTLRRGVAISKIPFVRLQGMLAKAEERLDHAWTAGMKSDMLCMLLWLVTRLRPDMQTSKLGVKSYKEAQKQCRNARSREFTIMGEQRYEQMIGELLRAGQQDFEDVAYKHGFQSAWLRSAKRSKAKSSGADTSIEALERQLKAARRSQGIDRAGSASASTAGGPPTPAADLAPAQGIVMGWTLTSSRSLSRRLRNERCSQWRMLGEQSRRPPQWRRVWPAAVCHLPQAVSHRQQSDKCRRQQ